MTAEPYFSTLLLLDGNLQKYSYHTLQNLSIPNVFLTSKTLLENEEGSFQVPLYIPCLILILVAVPMCISWR